MNQLYGLMFCQYSSTNESFEKIHMIGSVLYKMERFLVAASIYVCLLTFLKPFNVKQQI